MVPYLYDSDRLEMAFGLASDTYHDHIRYNPRLYLKADNQKATNTTYEAIFTFDLLDENDCSGTFLRYDLYAIDELNDEEKMKVALAKALIKRPKFLLIDEAFDKLDKKDDLLKLIDEFGVATIYVTKDEMIAKSLSNKYYEIEDAKIEEKEFI